MTNGEAYVYPEIDHNDTAAMPEGESDRPYFHSIEGEGIVRRIPDGLGVRALYLVTDAPETPIESDDAEPADILPGVTVSTDSVRDYMRKSGRVALLTKEEEAELASAIEVGLFARERLDNGAFETDSERIDLEYLARTGESSEKHLVEANLRLVISIAKRYRSRGIDFMDLIQEGNKGLVHAVRKFDYEKGFKFSTYSTWWIKQAITRALSDQVGDARIPAHMGEKITKIDKIRAVMTQNLGRKPTDEELSAETGFELDKMRRWISDANQTRNVLSLDAHIGGDGDASLADIAYDPTVPSVIEEAQANILDEERAEMMQQLLDTVGLSENERIVIDRYYGFLGADWPTAELAEYLGVSTARVGQIKKNAIAKLRRFVKKNDLAGVVTLYTRD